MVTAAGSRNQALSRPPARSCRSGWGGLALAAFAALAPLAPPARGQGTPAGGSGVSFEGNWTATGTSHVLAMGSDRRAATVHLSGSLVLTAGEGLSRGFRIEAIAFSDGLGTTLGECVWTDDRGEQLFSDIKGGGFRTGRHVVGTITGGTGRYAGVSGGYEFDWQYVVSDPEGGFQAAATGLRGRVSRLAPTAGQEPR